MMHRFLNASDGLISMKGKKIIFTTNIPNIGDIDDALIRPGRCFDILNFRNLTKLEAQVVVDEFYTGEKPVLDKDKYSLAEVTNLGRNRGKSRNKTGFV
jgi:ATP-dependent 26S proteasome regulatory subunit